MIRTFHSIGQGAFYTEIFNNYIVAYDCGSSNKNLIINEINWTLNQGEIIDVVFISHFDSDHINGLEHLLKHCKVKKLILPLIHDDEKIEWFVHNYVNGVRDDFIDNLINEPSIVIKKETELYFIDRVKGKQDSFDIKPISFEKLKGNVLENVKLYFEQISNWVYIPFNFQSEVRSLCLKEELQSRNLDIKNVRDFQEAWSDSEKRKSIKEAYKKIPGDINSNSLTLYSGPEKIIAIQKILNLHYHLVLRQFSYSKLFKFFKSNAGCLYYGDYNAKGTQNWTELYNRYKNYCKYLGILQVPHHGSHKNYNPSINSKKNLLSVISAGISNQHGHPHPSTVRKILNNDGIPLIVNENPGSRVICDIYSLNVF